MKLSKIAQELSSKKIEEIQLHPFHQEMKAGTLAKDKFAYYVEQDGIFLQGAAKSLALLASKVPVEYVQQFLCYSNDMFVAEEEVVHNFFKKAFNFEETGLIAPSTLSYTNFHLSTCALQPVEVGVAAMLPGFLVYHQIGLSLAKEVVPNNPYQRWIETYSGADFGNAANEVEHVFNSLAENTTEALRKKMIETFSHGVCLEWHFCNDCYNKALL
ncbi:MAG: TenA family protein [Chthoniobacterales bacterium]